jgi:hypothetical protein
VIVVHPGNHVSVDGCGDPDVVRLLPVIFVGPGDNFSIDCCSYRVADRFLLVEVGVGVTTAVDAPL